MKKIKWLLCAMSIVFALTTGSAGAVAASGHLDPAFGRNGKVTLPSPNESLVDAALLPDGGVLVAGRDQLLKLLPSGQIDRSFGESGRMELVPPLGAREAFFDTVLIDSLGRILVVGICDFSKRTGVHELIETDYLPRQILAQRYMPDGKLDPSFGNGGTVLTDFGLPPAQPGRAPHLFFWSATLDPSDRLLITGARRTERRDEAFVGRLTGGGENDSSFAPSGGLSLAGFSYVGKPVAANEDGVFLIAGHGFRKRSLLHLEASEDGDLNWTVVSEQPLTRAALFGTLTEDPAGRLLFANQLLGSREQNIPNGVQIKRLQPNGTPDRSFGNAGAVAFRFARLTEVRLATDVRGRALIAMELNTLARPFPVQPKPAALVLMRLRSSGALDRSFGRNGLVRIRLNATELEGWFQGLDLVGGRALLGGTWCWMKCRSLLTRIAL